MTFTNRGGLVKSWILKKYNDDQGKPLELVSKAAEQYGYPMSLWTYDEVQRNKINSALYVVTSDHGGTASKIGPGVIHAPADITFEYADGDVAVRKTLSFDHTYVVHLETSVVSKGSQVTAFPMWPAGFGDQSSPSSYAGSSIEHQYNDKTERLAIKKVSGGATLQGPFNWAGVVDQYFAAVFLPDDIQNAAIVTLRHQIEVPKDARNPKPNETIKEDVLGVGVGNLHGPTVERVYVGPKSLGVLEAVSVPTLTGAPPDLRALVNFGFFGIIARPLFLWLKWTYGWMHNWGWAIVVQTLIINVALLPLRISSMKSALKMQKVAPQIKAIQEKYKKYSMRDPRKQEMNQEVSALVQGGGRKSGGRLSAHGHPDAVPVRLLQHAGRGPGSAAGALAVDPGPLLARPMASVAHRHYHHHAVDPAHDAATGDGPVAAENDELHDAADAGRHQLEPGRRLVPVLVRRQSGRNCAAGSDESHQPGPGDAGDCAEEGEEEREISY